jgi:TRAP-type C4-dicarboxylate transport system permease small subunit
MKNMSSPSDPCALPTSDGLSQDVASPQSSQLLIRLDRILGVIFILVVFLNFASAAGRYLGGRPIMGADEVQVFTMIWLIFMGAVLAAIRRAHLRMDVLSASLSPRLASIRHLGEAVLTFLVCGVMVWISLRFTLDIHAMEQKSDGAEIPMWIPHASAVVGFAGMAICALAELLNLIRQGRSDTTRHIA